jgi:hypothetical protein
MKRIDKFLDDLYRDSDLNPAEVEEMKEEMRTHLLDYINEAKENGLSEDQAVIEALQHFGGESEIFEDVIKVSKKKSWGKWFVVSMILLCASILAVGSVWGVEQFKKQERQAFYNGIVGALYMNDQLSMESIEKEVNRAIQEGEVKDVVITKGTNASSPVLYQTIDTEGFPADDSYLIETKVDRVPAVHPNSENSYLVAYSYNVIRFEPVLQLAAILFIGFLITLIVSLVRRRS